MKTMERRMEILFLLVHRRSIHLSDLQSEFQICKRTAIHDIQELSRIFPIYTEQGLFGGVFLAKELLSRHEIPDRRAMPTTCKTFRKSCR